MVEITNEASLVDWLDQLSTADAEKRQLALVLAHRSAMRVLPIAWGWIESSSVARELELSSIVLLRADITCALGFHTRSAQVRNAIGEVTDAVFALSNSVDVIATAVPDDAAKIGRVTVSSAAAAVAATSRATESVARSGSEIIQRSASAVGAGGLALEHYGADPSAFWAALSADCALIDGGRDLRSSALWHSEDSPLDALWGEFKAYLQGATVSEDWAFWIDWYERSLKGHPLSWEGVIEPVVLIDDQVWRRGTEAIAEAIETIYRGERNGLTQLRAENRQLLALKDALEDRLEEFDDRIGLAEKRAVDLEANLSAHEPNVVKVLEASELKIEAFKKSYEETMVSEDAYDLWDEKRKEHETRRKSAYCAFCTGLVLVGLGVALLIYLLVYKGGFVDTHLLPSCQLGQTCSAFSFRTVSTSLAVLTLFTVMLWYVRLKMKEYLAERHLELDARERMAFTRTYVGLLANEATSKDAQEVRAQVYSAIFRPSSDGIIKEDGGLDPSIAAAISKFLSK